MIAGKSAGRVSMLLIGAALACQAAPASAAYLELGIAIDDSGSIDATEFAYQVARYVNVLTDPGILPLDGSVAISVVHYASIVHTVFPMAEITSANIDALISAISTRELPGGSSNGDAAVSALLSNILSNDVASSRQVISISGDDWTQSAANISDVRDHALSLGIDQINCIALAGAASDFCDPISGGEGSFAAYPADAAAFEAAFARNITENLAPVPPSVPEPGAWAMLIAGFGAIGGLLRRRRRPVAATA